MPAAIPAPAATASDDPATTAIASPAMNASPLPTG